MADLSVTAANVLLTSGNATAGMAGATITAGQSVYSDSTEATNKIKAADANALASGTVVGIALNGAATGQPIDYAPSGTTVNPGATTAAGTIYCVSETAGGIGTSTDIGSGVYMSVIGIGTATNAIKVQLINSGVAVP